MKTLKLSVILILFTAINIYGVISFNDSDIAFSSNGAGDQAISNVQVKAMVIQGAGYYLESHSQMLLFLNKFELSELSGLHFDEVQVILNAAISGMENARDTYLQLKNLAAATPYDQSVINQLKGFDYAGLRADKSLNPSILNRAQGFLGQGNVTGLYEEILTDTGKILEMLDTVKQAIDKQESPDIPTLWKLNQMYAQSLLFGQYTAQVFRAIK